MKKENFIRSLCLVSIILLSGCAGHQRQVFTAGAIGAAAGAGLGYTVVHHGKNREYVVPNTIITSAVIALTAAALTSYHYRSLDAQRVEITSRFGRSRLLETQDRDIDDGLWQQRNHRDAFTPSGSAVGEKSIRLDENTRWVFPTFRKRHIRPEATEEQFLSSRYSWEIVRPGYFVTRDEDPRFFKHEESSQRFQLEFGNDEENKSLGEDQ